MPAGTRVAPASRSRRATGPATIPATASATSPLRPARSRPTTSSNTPNVDAHVPNAIAGSSAAGAASRRSGRPSVVSANTTATTSVAAAAARDDVENAVNAPSEARASPVTWARVARARPASVATAPSIARLLALPSVPCRRPVRPNDSVANARPTIAQTHSAPARPPITASTDRTGCGRVAATAAPASTASAYAAARSASWRDASGDSDQSSDASASRA